MGENKEKRKEERPRTEIFDRAALQKFLGGYIGSGMMASDFESLPPRARIEAVARLAAYVMPKLKSVDMDMGIKAADRRIHDLSAAIDSAGETGDP